ncbi:MAG: hypothetical protein ACR2KV_08885 [Solirubrobacteraceae bacterium]
MTGGSWGDAWRRPVRFWLIAAAVCCVCLGFAGPAAADVVGNFSVGQLQATAVGATGCGTNSAGEPALHISRVGNLFLGSESGVLGGSQLWRGLGALGGSSASPCGLEYRGQPNVLLPGIGLAGGDIDIAVASAPNAAGSYNLYVASLYLASVNVAHSLDNGATFAQTPVVFGIPLDDREWIAAFGAHTSLLSYHDIVTNDINVLRSDDDGGSYIQIAQAIPLTDYRARNNQIGNLVIDHRNLPPGGGFYAYQSFVAPSTPAGAVNNEAFLAVSPDGGHTWTDQAIPCSVQAAGLDHNFPNVSVDPAGNVWYAWSDDHNVSTAESTDRGQTWTCSGPVSTNTSQAIYPWMAATAHGVDLVYYGSPTAPGSDQTFYVYFAQNLYTSAGAPIGWRRPQQLVAVHHGPVCEGGIVCTGGRQLFDDFAVDTDRLGYAHIAYSQDSPALGGPATDTGYAVQRHGLPVGSPNN